MKIAEHYESARLAVWNGFDETIFAGSGEGTNHGSGRR